MKTDMYRYVAPRRERAGSSRQKPDVVCFSHLRWDSLVQRTHHLIARCARRRRVFFVEEAIPSREPPRIEVEVRSPGVHAAVPYLPEGIEDALRAGVLARLIGEMFRRHAIDDPVLWYDTPMALPYTRHLIPRAVVYDCTEERSAIPGAPASLRDHEAELFRRANLVIAGGASLFEAKRTRHRNIHPVPSSVDVVHFERARGALPEPADQAGIPRPRLGFFGVIDRRVDLTLVDEVARLRPDLQIVLVGPVIGVDRACLPRRPNIHYLGEKGYAEVPAYMAGWDVGLLPFARGDATRYLSPDRIPEYLAAGRHVVATSIRDVVRPYGELGLVRVADSAVETVAAVEACLEEDAGPLGPQRRRARLSRVDTALVDTSWDDTWAQVESLLQAALLPRIQGRAH